MISIEEAVSAAKAYAARVFSESELKQLRVEEIESTRDDTQWLVTLGWLEPAVRQLGGLGAFAGLSHNSLEAVPRVYKIFTIDAETGDVKSMKMR